MSTPSSPLIAPPTVKISSDIAVKTSIQPPRNIRIIAVSLAALAIGAFVFAQLKYGALTIGFGLAVSNPLITAGIGLTLLAAISFFEFIRNKP